MTQALGQVHVQTGAVRSGSAQFAILLAYFDKFPVLTNFAGTVLTNGISLSKFRGITSLFKWPCI